MVGTGEVPAATTADAMRMNPACPVATERLWREAGTVRACRPSEVMEALATAVTTRLRLGTLVVVAELDTVREAVQVSTAAAAVPRLPAARYQAPARSNVTDQTSKPWEDPIFSSRYLRYCL